MGIYDKGSLQTPEFRTLPVSQGVPPSISLWSLYGLDDYSASHSKATQLKSNSNHLLYYIMARSTTGRMDSEGIVNARDLF